MNTRFKKSLILVLAGILAMAVGIFFTMSGKKQVARDTEPATASVVSYVEGSEYNSTSETYDTVYYPVMSYEVDGQTIESQYSQYDYSQTYEIGENVEIKYNPDNPEEFIISDDSGSLQFGTIWVIVIGAVLLVIGLARIIVPVIGARK